jgi:hypothetical protein
VRAIRGRASAFGSNLVFALYGQQSVLCQSAKLICSNAVTLNRLSDFRHGHKPW